MKNDRNSKSRLDTYVKKLKVQIDDLNLIYSFDKKL
jgi:hypothetical protein